MRFCTSKCLDVFTNLAIEDALMSDTPEPPPTLFLWRSQPAVVIGKHQNPWRECHLRDMEAAGVQLARRISGGGCVYHDEGNLNYAFFTRRCAYRQDAVFDVVLAALADLAIEAHRMGKSSLGINGRKFSGSAFCYRRNAVLHHGTLLIDANLGALARMLKGTDDTYTTHAVASEPAPVTNLTASRPGLTLESVEESLLRRFEVYTAQPAERMDLFPMQDMIIARARQMRSEAWCYDRTPSFVVALETTHDAHAVRIELAVRDGHVERMSVTAPSEVAAVIDPVRSLVEGKRFGCRQVSRELRDAIRGWESKPMNSLGLWLAGRLDAFEIVH